MKCCLLRHRRAPVRASTSGAALAAQLRAQIPCSTDPARLERMAREAEERAHPERPILPFAKSSPAVAAGRRASKGIAG